MKWLMAALAGAVLLGSCAETEGPDATAPFTEAEDMTKPDAWQPPVMPTEEEAAQAASAAQAQAEAGVIYAGAAHKGGAVSVPLGETLRIELVSVPTAGYVWEITTLPDILELTGEGSRPTDPAVQNLEGFTGGNHFLSFDFKAISPGTGTVELAERRPWETDEPPMDTYSLAVTVVAPE